MKEARTIKSTKKMVFLEVEEKKPYNGFWCNFWGAFNQSRCKTTMMLASIMLIGTYCASLLLGVFNPKYMIVNPRLEEITIGVILYWMGRHSKAQENMLVCKGSIKDGGLK